MTIVILICATWSGLLCAWIRARRLAFNRAFPVLREYLQFSQDTEYSAPSGLIVDVFGSCMFCQPIKHYFPVETDKRFLTE